MSLDRELEKFYNYISSEKGYSLNTLESYSSDLKLLSNYLESKNKKSWERIEISDINNYFSSISKNSKATLKRKHAAIRSFFKFLENENQNISNILEKIKTPKIGSPIPKPLSIEEIEKIINFQNINDEDFTNTCIFTLMYASGLRVSEVISVKIGEIDLKQKTIKVTGKGNKQRILPIYQDAAKFISSYIKSVRKNLSNIETYSSKLFVRKNSKK